MTNRGKLRPQRIKATKAETEFEEDSDYIDLFASLASSHRQTVNNRTGIWVENAPNVNPE